MLASIQMTPITFPIDIQSIIVSLVPVGAQLLLMYFGIVIAFQLANVLMERTLAGVDRIKSRATRSFRANKAIFMRDFRRVRRTGATRRQAASRVIRFHHRRMRMST